MTMIEYIPYRPQASARFIIDNANEIIDKEQAEGYTLSVRQIYYKFVGGGLIENTERSYNNLKSTISRARVGGLISWTAIEDRGREFHEPYVNEDVLDIVSGMGHFYRPDYWQYQDVYVEAWIEKQALEEVLAKACNKWKVPYIACKGYMSSSEAWLAGQRYQQKAREGKRLVLIHLGDHDPSGIDMTRDNHERLERYSGGRHIDVRRIGLNMDQVEEYQPPENPTKQTDPRGTGYMAEFGGSSWELDALENKVIHNLVDSEIQSLVDNEIWENSRRLIDEKQDLINGVGDYWDEIEELIEERLSER